MRNFLMFMGSVLLMAVVIGGLGLVFVTIKGPELDRESRAFVDDAVQVIASEWNEQALIDRAAPELMQAVGPVVLERMFARFRMLGAMRSYEGAAGDASIALGSKGFSATALYIARGVFSAGEAVFRVALVRHKGEWRINSFRVDSEVLAQNKPIEQAVIAASGGKADADVAAYGAGSEGFDRWCRASFSAISLRYQSGSEVWIALSDAYGPYPTTALAARAAAKYLDFDKDAPSMKVVLFRANQRVAEATVNRQ